MPYDVRGRTRATMKEKACSFPCSREPGNPIKPLLDWDRGLELFPLNEEFLVNTSHQLVLIWSLPLVHTARRYYRLSDLVRTRDWRILWPSVARCVENMSKLDHLEEIKVVTRFPSVNQRKDHYGSHSVSYKRCDTHRGRSTNV